MLYTIKNITDKQTGKTADDWKVDYINRDVNLVREFLTLGRSAIMFVEDENSTLSTSRVLSITETIDDKIVIETRNSVYHLEILQPREEDAE
jgi:hypothetical protein